MKLTYDLRQKIAGIRLRKPGAGLLALRRRDAASAAAPEGAEDGTGRPIAHGPLRGEGGANLVFVNEARGDRREIPLGE
jgi:hypothetical protein